MDDFDKQFDRMQKTAIGVWVVGVLISLGLLAFGIWVVVKILQHFAII